jgi:hypothetical protein
MPGFGKPRTGRKNRGVAHRTLSLKGVRILESIDLETIVRRVAEQVIRELKNQGIRIVSSGPAGRPSGSSGSGNAGDGPPVLRPDLSGYKTPVLLERHLLKLAEPVGVLVVPRGTVISPRAKERLRDRNIQVRFE